MLQVVTALVQSTNLAASYHIPTSMTSAEDVAALCRYTEEGIITYVQECIATAQRIMDDIIIVPDDERTFANTMYPLDCRDACLQQVHGLCELIMLLDPRDTLRHAAQDASKILEAFVIERCSAHKEIYRAVMTYYNGVYTTEQLSSEQRYYVTEMIAGYGREGLDLPDEEQSQLKELRKKAAALCTEFDLAINADAQTLVFSREQLAGLSDMFIASLTNTDDGRYCMEVNRPRAEQVMKYCVVEDTRKAFWIAYSNRAYPGNNLRLQQIIALRDAIARLLGRSSFAALALENSMAKSPARVREFLDDIMSRIMPCMKAECAALCAELPEGVSLTAEGKFKPWDIAYIRTIHKQKYAQLDERVLAEYFPADQTLKHLLQLYTDFFGIAWQEVPNNGILWHPDVRCLAVFKEGRLLGHLALDLYPRPNKFSHAAQLDVVRTQKQVSGFVVVIANFPKAVGDMPALLTYGDVATFFHEFGHALHALLSETEMVGFAGTAVRHDFVEMPSQMLEEFIGDPAILVRVGAHYKTGEPLPQEIIERIVRARHFGAAIDMQGQIFFALLSLAYFDEGAEKDVDQVRSDLYQAICPYVLDLPENHFAASFGHLTGYGPRYYGYAWSKVFALDVFEKIKEEGILDVRTGLRYAAEVLAKGGSVEPSDLLRNFLGREPSADAFFKQLGIILAPSAQLSASSASSHG